MSRTRHSTLLRWVPRLLIVITGLRLLLITRLLLLLIVAMLLLLRWPLLISTCKESACCVAAFNRATRVVVGGTLRVVALLRILWWVLLLTRIHEATRGPPL